MGIASRRNMSAWSRVSVQLRVLGLVLCAGWQADARSLDAKIESVRMSEAQQMDPRRAAVRGDPVDLARHRDRDGDRADPVGDRAQAPRRTAARDA